MAPYNAVFAKAMSELFVEKGLLERSELLARVEKIKNELSTSPTMNSIPKRVS
jgi:hypothetical protein